MVPGRAGVLEREVRHGAPPPSLFVVVVVAVARVWRVRPVDVDILELGELVELRLLLDGQLRLVFDDLLQPVGRLFRPVLGAWEKDVLSARGFKRVGRSS